MGLYFHKRKKVGGFNFNFSSSGIGTSMKLFKGCNIGVDARGRTYISGGLFGFRYREYLDGNIEEEKDPKKELIKIIPNKYKNNIFIIISAILFWFFAINYILCIIGLFIPNIEKPSFGSYFIFTLLIAVWSYSLYFSSKSKQRRYIKDFINSMINDDSEFALFSLQKIIDLEKNKNLLEKLEKIKNTLLNAIKTSSQSN